MPRKVIHVLSKMEWMKNITQTAVMNIVHQRIFISNLTFVCCFSSFFQLLFRLFVALFVCSFVRCLFVGSFARWLTRWRFDLFLDCQKRISLSSTVFMTHDWNRSLKQVYVSLTCFLILIFLLTRLFLRIAFFSGSATH